MPHNGVSSVESIIIRHNAFITIDGKRIGKSEGNAITVRDIIKKGADPLALRYFFLTAHYRSQTNFTWDALTSAENSLKKIRSVMATLPDDGTVLSSPRLAFFKALYDDLNTPQALAVLWDTLHSTHAPKDIKATLIAFDEVLGLKLNMPIVAIEVPESVSTLVAERELARTEKRWADADKLRNEIGLLGYSVHDTPTGPRIEKA